MSRRRATQSLQVSRYSRDTPRRSQNDESVDIKSKYITDLEERNKRLKLQIIKIRELLAQQQQRQSKKQQHRLIPQDAPLQTIQMQLKNAYKQIRIYEVEIGKLEEKTEGDLIATKIDRLQKAILQKDAHIDKLKAQLSVVSKEMVDHSRKLKNNASKKTIQEQLLILQQEIRYLREKVRQGQQKEKVKMENAKKQVQYIKRVQKQLIEGGISSDQLEQLKKHNIFTSIVQRLNDSVSVREKKTIEEPSQQGQVTLSRYHDIRNQIKVKKKLQGDYQKKINMLVKEKEEEDKKVVEMRMKLIEKENQIDELEQMCKELKKKVKKSNLKPGVNSILVEHQLSSPKPPLPNKGSIQSNKKDSIDNHGHLKYDQKGLASQKGKKFTDRTVLGRNYQTKIIAVKLWIQKNAFNLCGIQCTYKHGDNTKTGAQHVIKKQGKALYNQQIFELEQGDYLKSISGSLSLDNIVQYIVLISAKAKIARYGIVNPNQKQFNYDIEQNEMPICCYGSLISRHVGRDQISYIELLGFEITQDNTPPEQQSV